MSTRRRKKPVQSADRAKQPSQLDHLVVMRESARYDHILMEGMIHQTLAKVADLPGAKELTAAGTDVLENPERWGATSLRTGDSRMALVERDGVLYLYSMGTAAKDDLATSNAFVSELVKVVEAYRPKEIWVAAFTRLLRSANYAGDLLRVFSEHTSRLHCEAEIDLATPEGKMVFQMLAMIAAAERDYIVRRHTAGRVAQWRRGEWIPNAYPPGYKKLDRRLVLDEGELDATRRMLTLLANEGLSPSECAARIGGLGLTTPMIARLHGEGATVADARNPSEVIATIVGWVELYATGRHTTIWPNPFPGVTEIAGAVVEDSLQHEFGELRLVQEVPLPDGGWADEATFDAIRARAGTPAVTGGASHSVTPPLSGLFYFSDHDYEYATTADMNTYRLLRRPRRDDRQFTGWHSLAEQDIEWLASVSRSEWHRSIADSLLAAVQDGLPGELDANRFQAVGPLPQLDARRARIRAVRHQLDDAGANLDRARRNAQLAGDDEAAQLFVEDVKRHLADKSRLERELAALEADLDSPELGETFETNADLVAHAVAALASVDQRSDSALRDALRTVISRERWWLEGEMVRWELFIELPHSDGTVILGPISGQVPDRRRTRKTKPRRARDQRNTRDRLIELGLGKRAAECASKCSHPELTAVLAAHLLGEPTPEGIDPHWAGHIVSTYTDPHFNWNRGHWRLVDDTRRGGLRILAEAGGRLGHQKILDAGLNVNQLRYLSRHTDAPSGEPILRRMGRGRDSTYALLDCPHCGGLMSHSVVTPETRPGVICPTCWRTPRPDSPVFPDWYRT